MLSGQIINAYNLPRLICPKGLGEERAGEVQGAEVVSDQGKAVESPVAVVVEADDFPIRSDTGGGCQVQSAGEVNDGEAARAQQKAVGNPGDIVVVADDLSPIVCERSVMADGNDYGIVLLKEAGQPVEPVYPTEGVPTISGPTGIFVTAPHPNAARLFQAWLHTRETQQFFIDFTAQYSVHTQVQSKPGRRKISDIKLMKEDAAGVEAMSEEIKTRYAKLFRV